MADQSDVELALVQATTGALYPGGQSAPCVLGSPVRVYRGSPLPLPLKKDLASGVCNVSILSIEGDCRNTSRWTASETSSLGKVTLTATVSGTSVTFSGRAGAGQIAGIVVDDKAFVYRGLPGDTVAVVAAVLAAEIAATRTCWLSGATLTIPGAHRLIGRVVADGLTSSEVVRQEQGFRISAWCPSPSLRDRICSTLMVALTSTAFLTLTDGSAGRLRYRSTASFDDERDLGQYRRDLIYDVEYGALSHVPSPAMLFGDLNLGSDAIFT